MEYFKSVCESKFNISDAVISEWCNFIKSQYSNERHYHNLDMLAKKMKVIEEEFSSYDSLKNALIVASVFHHLHFDVKVDKSIDNCEEFKRFVDEAKIEDVSYRKINLFTVILL